MGQGLAKALLLCLPDYRIVWQSSHIIGAIDVPARWFFNKPNLA